VHREVLRTQGRLASRFAYDGVGRKRAAWTRPAALKVSGAWQNSLDWQTRLKRPGFDDTLLKSYDYDKAGELTGQQHSRNGHTQHRYDQAGRIESTLHQSPTGEGAQPNAGAPNTANAPNGLSENFYFDPAGNRISALEHSSLSTQNRGWVEHNRVKVFEDKRFDYDGYGRLIRKRIGSHTEQHYQYNSQHQLIKVAVVRAGSDGQPHTQAFEYQYDVLGRRIAKRDAFGATRFTWEGMRLLQEKRGQQLSTYLYEEGGYTPLARIDGEGAINPHPAAATAFGNVDTEQGKLQSIPVTNPAWGDRFHVLLKDGHSNSPTSTPPAANEGQWGQPLPGQATVAAQAAKSTTPSTATTVASGEPPKPPAQIYYFHTQTNGLPEELSDNGGNLVWRAQYKTWGATVREEWQAFDDVGKPVGGPEAQPVYQPATNCLPLEQNLRMQGQYLDRETGLHYNTFRFYDPDLGAFTTPDPIGLVGGFNLYSYAPNPIAWIDPWGWAKECGGGTGAKRGPKTDPNAPHNRKIREVGDRIEANGGTVLAGGGRGKEKVVPTTGGHKDTRRPDVLYRDKDGTIRGVNVGKTKADGTPVTREQKAMDDLNNKGGIPTTFEPYDR
jgi:RHS repeat-associated protein